MTDQQQDTKPTEETISLRWLVHRISLLFALCLVLVLIAEALQAYATTDMAVSLRVLEGGANTLLVALVALAGADKLIGKKAPRGNENAS